MAERELSGADQKTLQSLSDELSEVDREWPDAVDNPYKIAELIARRTRIESQIAEAQRQPELTDPDKQDDLLAELIKDYGSEDGYAIYLAEKDEEQFRQELVADYVPLGESGLKPDDAEALTTEVKKPGAARQKPAQPALPEDHNEFMEMTYGPRVAWTRKKNEIAAAGRGSKAPTGGEEPT